MGGLRVWCQRGRSTTPAAALDCPPAHPGPAGLVGGLAHDPHQTSRKINLPLRIRHAGLKARISGNEKREERFLLPTVNSAD